MGPRFGPFCVLLLDRIICSVKNNMLIFAIDVLTWVIYGCKLYVKIIIVHGVLMFHVALIYTCNMKENALASCVSHAQSHRVESGVSACY